MNTTEDKLGLDVLSQVAPGTPSRCRSTDGDATQRRDRHTTSRTIVFTFRASVTVEHACALACLLAANMILALACILNYVRTESLPRVFIPRVLEVSVLSKCYSFRSPPRRRFTMLVSSKRTLATKVQ